MAKFDWQTTADALEIEIQTATGTDLIIAQRIVDELYRWGQPYDTGFTQAIDNSKGSVESARAAALSEWEATTTVCHNQTASAINFMEGVLGQPITSFAGFESDATASSFAVGAFKQRIGVLTSVELRNNNTELLVTLGQADSDVLLQYRDEITAAYAARPLDSAIQGLFTQTLISIPQVGNRTIEQAETFLIRKEAEGVALLSVI
jgi:hypothetical protein